MVWRYWHSTLVNGKNPLLGKGRQVSRDSLIICRWLEYRNFSIYYPFYTFIQESYQVPVQDRCFFECILGSQPQKPYFDIDFNTKRQVIPSVEGITAEDEDIEQIGWTLEKAKLVVKDLIRSILDISSTFPGSAGIKLEDIMVFSSHGKTPEGDQKLSYHVVVDRWCFPDVVSNKFFCGKVIDNMKLNLAAAVDHHVYKNLQQFRTYMSAKYQKGRIKILDTELCSWQPLAWGGLSDNPARRYYQILFASLISLTSTCKIIGYEVPQKSIRTDWIEHDDLSDAVIVNIRESVDLIIDGVFDIADIKGRMVILKRLRPGFCPICEREHEHENAFLTVSGDGFVWYHCHRADTSTKVILSVIDAGLINSAVVNGSTVKTLEYSEPDHETSKHSVFKRPKIEFDHISKETGARLYRRLTGFSAVKQPKQLRYLLG